MARSPSTLRVVLTHLALVVITLLALYPVLWVVRMALSPSQQFSSDPTLLSGRLTLQNFVDVIWTFDGGYWLFGAQLFNSLVVATATAGVGLVLATSAGYALSRWAFPGRDAGMSAFLVTQMFPGVVMAIPLYILLDTLGLLDSLLGLALVYATTAVPFSVWTLKGYFDTIPVALEEAALLDGASRWTTFTKVILPLARPALAVTGLFSFMTAWNEYILAATLLGDPRAYTLPVVLQSYVDDYGASWGHFAAGAILVSIPVVALFFALQRYFVEGLTSGAVKG
ncbi:MAG: sugar ABC transporter permease [Deltaproteobacteria bacterium]|nr:MAG: sugar ABC transporter permease [Deltaproteobacteria bacterium]